MSDEFHIDRLGSLWPRKPPLGLVAALAIAAFGLIRYDLVVGVEYVSARVLTVVHVPGGDAFDRLVTVDLGDYNRALRTQDWMVVASPGASVCVKRTRYLLRRFTRHRLDLPGYCRPARNLAEQADGAYDGGRNPP